MNKTCRPNFLLIISDDLTYNDLPLYGGQNVRTPNIDRLGGESLVFNQAYLAQAMCQPCRAELYTGLYPVSNGCAWNHSASRPDITSMPHHMREVGYRTGIAGKIHVGPKQTFPFEYVDGFDRNCCNNPTLPHTVDGISEFFGRSDDEPFCLVIGLVDPHAPWVMGDASQYPEEELKLPPHLADTPITRKAFSHYLAEITYMDGQVGDILKALDASGKSDNTVVLFTSEQGAQFPGGKWTNWNIGLHTAMTVRWPGVVAPGRTDALVQYADVMPTFVDIGGGNPEKYSYDGSSFRQVLTGEKDSHREYVYGIHNNQPEGPAYPVRTVFDGTHRYIRNLLPDNVYIEKHLMSFNPNRTHENYWQSWVGSSFEDENTYKLVKRYMSRPPEELYLSNEDPFEHRNLADDPAQADVKARLSAELDRWMASQADPGAAMDTLEALEAARRGEHLHGPGKME